MVSQIITNLSARSETMCQRLEPVLYICQIITNLSARSETCYLLKKAPEHKVRLSQILVQDLKLVSLETNFKNFFVRLSQILVQDLKLHLALLLLFANNRQIITNLSARSETKKCKDSNQ